MTDIDLQTAIMNELKDMCRDESLMMPIYESDEDGPARFDAWKEYNIYRQDKPYKNEELPEEQENYMLVTIGDEDTDEDGNWIVQIYIIIGISLYEESHQGNLILANLMNQIEYRFQTKGILVGQYQKEAKAHKRFSDQCEPDFYECNYITYWKIPQVIQEGLEEML